MLCVIIIIEVKVMAWGVKRNCYSCGAPITTEVCPYCNNMTGLDT